MTRHQPPSEHLRNTARGFTLVELLIVIGIIVVLAVVSMMLVKTARISAWASASSANLRQCAIAVQNHVGDKGHYPECYDFTNSDGSGSGGPWSWQIREYLGFSTVENWPGDPILHPRHGKRGMDRISNSIRPNIHHFASSAIAFQDVDESNPNTNSRYTRPSLIGSPEKLILIGDAPLKNPTAGPSSGCHAAWWGIRFSVVQGNPEEAINPSNLKSSMDFWYRGKAQFMFADGHVETLAPTAIKKKNFQL